jgi:hypothetical protein
MLPSEKKKLAQLHGSSYTRRDRLSSDVVKLLVADLLS